MTGLRQKQKADRQKRILDAASDLFRGVGYEAARIEDIAERAEVSAGTVYNYFGYKGDVLVAIVSMEVEEILSDGARLVDEPPAEVARAVGELIAHYYDHSLVYLSKEMWRTAMALAIRDPESPVSRRYTALDARLADQVCQLIHSLQARGRVTPELDGTAIGQLIFNNLNMMFIEFVKDEAMSLDTLKERVSRQNAPLLSLVEANRHETELDK